MAEPKSARKQPNAGRAKRTYLRLVKRPRRRRWKWNLGIPQRTYEHNRELHVWENEIVYAAVVEMGGATIKDLEERWPGRFRRKPLWRTLNRLAKDARLEASGASRWYLSGVRLLTRFTPTSPAARKR